MPRLLALVVNYNAGELLAKSLGSLLCEPLIDRVLVVDNASSDFEPASLATLSTDPSRLQLHCNQRNVGLARAINQCLADIEEADWLLLANPDAWPEPGAIASMLDASDAIANTGLVGAWVVDDQGVEQRATRRHLPTPWRAIMTFSGLERMASRWPLLSGVNIRDDAMPDSPLPVEAVSGAFLLIRVSALRELGGMDGGFFLHCEDLDLFLRLRKAGYAIVLDPGARVVHRQGTPSASAPARVWWHKHRSMARYLFKHADTVPGLLLAALVLPALLVRGGLGALVVAVRRR